MRLKDYHIHTSFSDGADTPEEVVLAAIEQGIDEIGFSDHSYISYPYDIVYWMGKDDEQRYKDEIIRLKEKYGGKIKILLGIEQDYYSDHPALGYDYIIGSVHFVKTNGRIFGVDEDEEYTKTVLEHFDGDMYAIAEEYYKTVADVVEKTNCDIIGHFDLISKFNERSHFLDENHPRYVKAWQSAADKLLKAGKPFEINMGGMISGLKTSPYPGGAIYDYLKSGGAEFILSSDAHKKEYLCFGFKRFNF